MSTDHELRLHPAWKQAVEDAHRDFGYGDLIKRDWLDQAFEIEDIGEPSDYRNRAELIAAVDQQRFTFLQAMDRFRTELLNKYRKALRAVPGVGYEIIEPPKQTDYAMERLRKQVGKAINDAQRHLVNINERLLDEEAAQHNAEQRAKLAQLATMSRSSLERRRLQQQDDDED